MRFFRTPSFSNYLIFRFSYSFITLQVIRLPSHVFATKDGKGTIVK